MIKITAEGTLWCLDRTEGLLGLMLLAEFDAISLDRGKDGAQFFLNIEAKKLIDEVYEQGILLDVCSVRVNSVTGREK